MNASVLVVGLGQIGVGYDLKLGSDHVYSHARAFSQHTSFDLIGGVDPDPRQREIFQETYGLPAWSDIEAPLRQRHVDVVTIAGPTDLHGEILRQVLDWGDPRVILCEKPISNDVTEAGAMVQACAEEGVGLYVNFVRRSDPGVIETKRLLDSGELGAPVKGVAWYSKGFLHNGSHLFNLLEYWLGPMQGARVLDPGRFCDDADSEPDVRVVFSRGPIVFLAAREENFSHHTVELLTTRGRLRYDCAGHQIQWHPAQLDPDFEGYSALSPHGESIPSGLDRYQWNVAEQMAAAIRGADAELCSGEEALSTLRSMHSIVEASLLGRPASRS